MASRRPRPALTKTRLKLLIGAFFLALCIPALLLVRQGFSQLELDAFRRHQVLAEELLAGIDGNLASALQLEETRAFGEYTFLVSGDPASSARRSVLSTFPVAASLPGLVGYFQVDANGELSTPLLPDAGIDARDYGIPEPELAARGALQDRIRKVLAENRLVRQDAAAPSTVAANAVEEIVVTAARVGDAEQPADSEQTLGQAVFDQLLSRNAAAEGAASAGRAASSSEARAEATAPLPAARSVVVDDAAVAGDRDQAQAFEEKETLASELNAPPAAKQESRARVSTFDNELDPFTLSRLDTGYYVIFRNAWRDGRRFVQGALIEPEAFLDAAILQPFRDARWAGRASLFVSYTGREVGFQAASANARFDPALLSARLSPPFADLELRFAAADLPLGPGRDLLIWVSVALLVVLTAGCLVLYRFSWGQTLLLKQQQDFVSAVSHELKTPLTSIRMYGEMLKSGWADDGRKKAYYDYILDESERLSRLIENVLQLARMTRAGPELTLGEHTVAQLIELTKRKVTTQLERAGFTLDVACDEALHDRRVAVDMDSFAQVVINLVDNAIKFAAEADNKTVELKVKAQDGQLLFALRDFGPGVPRAKMRKLFELFYRPENQLTRATRGTGIGLALVKQLTQAMQGQVDVRNREPGAEFVVALPELPAANAAVQRPDDHASL